jgi:Rha family phage regulatory protein
MVLRSRRLKKLRVQRGEDMKNMLTFAFQKGYSGSLKTANTASAPRQRVFFISVFYGRMRAENNQYQPKHLLAAFSESAHCSVSAGILRKVYKMNALVKILNNQVITDTTMIAVVFGKKHCDVMRAVQQLDLPEDFGKRNFALSSYHAGTRDYPMYEITRDGFTLLAMGFIGKKAMEWKIKYINAFNTMEKALREQNPAPTVDTKAVVDELEIRKAKNMLTFAFQKGYSGSLKTCIHGFRTRQFCDFFVYPYGLDENRKYIEYRSKLLYTAFSESARCSISTGILRKVYKMNALVKILNNQVITDTTMIAVVFGKKHCDVMRAVQQLDLPEDFGKRNFALSSYHAGTRDYPMYEITRDGFTLLAMGFIGKKAMEWKIKYINAFNTMEKALREQNPAPTVDMKAVVDELEIRKAKNMLTTLNLLSYSASTDLHSGFTAPKVLADFFIPKLWGDEKPNTLNKARGLCTSVESPACSISSGFTESIDKMKELISYTFKSTEIRTTIIDDKPWFVAADVATALEYRDAGNAVRILDDDEKGTHIVSTPSGNQDLTIINESGLYSLILRSRKPEAKAFKKFVTSEVLPAIRRQGYYATPGEICKMVKAQCVAAIKDAVTDILESAEQSDAANAGEVSDADLIRTLWNWSVTRNKDRVEMFKSLTREKNDLRAENAKLIWENDNLKKQREEWGGQRKELILENAKLRRESVSWLKSKPQPKPEPVKQTVHFVNMSGLAKQVAAELMASKKATEILLAPQLSPFPQCMYDFTKERLKFDEEAVTACADVYDAFKEYCFEHKQYIPSANKFGRFLYSLGVRKATTRRGDKAYMLTLKPLPVTEVYTPEPEV